MLVLKTIFIVIFLSLITIFGVAVLILCIAKVISLLPDAIEDAVFEIRYIVSQIKDRRR